MSERYPLDETHPPQRMLPNLASFLSSNGGMHGWLNESRLLQRNCSTASFVRSVLVLVTALSLISFWQSGKVTESLLAHQGNSHSGEPFLVKPPKVVTTHSSSGSTTMTRLQFSIPCTRNVSCTTTTLPQWMQDYLQWHSRTLQRIQQPQQWLRQKLLVVRCLDQDRCGGTADRLKSLPLYLAVAHKTKRLLFLRWTRPFRLEEFMIPSPAMNWTVPDTLAPLLDSNSTSKLVFGSMALNQIVKAAHNPKHWLIEAAAQMAGGDLFRDFVTDFATKEPYKEPLEFFHEMFLSLFRPSPALHKLVDHQMQALDLWPNQFVVAHIRAKYPGEPYRETWNLTLLQRSVTNAVDCAASLAPSKNTPVYVASDTLASLQAAQAYGRKHPSFRVVSHLDVPEQEEATNSQDIILLPHQDPPHLNFAKKEDPSAFFSIFADLFIMSQSQCVSFGAGGFGRFGSLVSFNATCRVAHSNRGKLNNCTMGGNG